MAMLRHIPHSIFALTVNLQQDKHKRKSTAVVLPVRMGDEGVALESSFRDGVKNEVLRSLCQLVNTSELALEVRQPTDPHHSTQLNASFAEA